MSYLVVY